MAMIRWDTRSVEHGFETLRQIGRIFNRSLEAEAIISRNREELDLIRRKVAALPADIANASCASWAVIR